jgi:hypothetical protein
MKAWIVLAYRKKGKIKKSILLIIYSFNLKAKEENEEINPNI